MWSSALKWMITTCSPAAQLFKWLNSRRSETNGLTLPSDLLAFVSFHSPPWGIQAQVNISSVFAAPAQVDGFPAVRPTWLSSRGTWSIITTDSSVRSRFFHQNIRQFTTNIISIPWVLRLFAQQQLLLCHWPKCPSAGLCPWRLRSGYNIEEPSSSPGGP